MRVIVCHQYQRVFLVRHVNGLLHGVWESNGVQHGLDGEVVVVTMVNAASCGESRENKSNSRANTMNILIDKIIADYDEY